MIGQLRSGELAEAAGVSRPTLRYYERRGLLAQPQRSQGGHRLYPPESLTTLRIIKTAQRLGFTLAEVADLLDLGTHRHEDRAETGFPAQAAAKLAEIESRIADLRAIATTLRTVIEAGCDDLIACAATAGCPIPFAGTGHGISREAR